jgi:hypothetical protein
MASTFTDFIAARNSGRTNTIEVLEKIFNEFDQNHPHFGWFSQARALDNPIPPEVRGFLTEEGLQDVEIDHLDDWPARQKERIRRRVVTNALSSQRRLVQMLWQVTMLNDEQTEIDEPPPDSNDRIVITTTTPWRNIRISADGQSVTVVTGS